MNVFKIELPPLRNRKEDIHDLVNYFLKKGASEIKADEKNINEAALKALINYNWPGNIRQLENMCRFITVMAPSNIITIDDIPDEIKLNGKIEINRSEQANGTGSWINGLTNHIKEVVESTSDLSSLSKELEKIMIEEALNATKGKKIEAAKLLGLGRNTITRKIKELDI